MSTGLRTWLARLLTCWIAVTPLLVMTGVRAENDHLRRAIEQLSERSFGKTLSAIDHIVQSGAPQSYAIIDALGDRRLFLAEDGTSVFYRDADGNVRNALNGEVVSPSPSGLKAARINNRVRSAVAAAKGALRLLHPEPARRAEAAAAVFAARDDSALPSLEIALTRETEPAVASRLRLARAAIIAGRPDTNEAALIEAIAELQQHGGNEVLYILKAIPSSAEAPVREAAERAIASIERRLAWWAVAQNLWYGISLGSVLLLAAIGLAITFGVMGVINMAHGEMVMLGAYSTFVVQEIIRASAPGLLEYSLIFAIPLAFIVSGSVGIAIERGVIRLLYGRPLETLLATWGISLILQQTVRTIFGPTNREVATPQFMSGTVSIGDLAITWNRLYIVIFAGLIFVGLVVALRFTTFGLHVRAVTQNRRMAGSMGIPTDRVDALTFGLGSGVAGLAGVALSQIDNVSPNLGQSYIIDSFLVVVFGGVGNLWGTLVGALALGGANKLLEPYAGAVLGKILLLVLVILFTQKRPRGLFALKGRAVEA